MYTPSIETILAPRPDGALGQPQQQCEANVERVNTAHEKAATLARLTIQLAMVGAEQGVCHGHA
jgi:hypothetical protein